MGLFWRRQENPCMVAAIVEGIQDEKDLEIDGGDGCATHRATLLSAAEMYM